MFSDRLRSPRHKQLTVLAAIVSLTSSAPVLAAGGKNAYNNPNGNPAEDTVETQYTNPDGGSNP
jgi:hypothetical protein